MASAGDQPPDGPGTQVSLPVTDTFTLAGRGHPLSADDMRLLSSCAVPVLAGLVRRRQDERDAHVARQAADSHSLSAVLATTGQQAREQLRKADTALAVLADSPATISPAERAALASDARRALAQVTRLLTDLSDLRRVHSGALETYQRSVRLDEVLVETLADLGPGGPEITLSVPEDLPDVIADVDLLSRILTSLIADALHRSHAGCPPALAAACHESRIEIQITDHGSPQAEEDSLGFRLARDFTETMGDALQCTQNEDGGRTVIITLPAAATAERPKSGRRSLLSEGLRA
jgi:two-component system sensor histidine kinase KdpD